MNALRNTIASLLFLGLIGVTFRPPIELVSTGIANGALYGLTAVGIILVYRNNRIINFAAAGLGAVPGVLAALLVSRKGAPFFLALLVALVGGALVGAGVDVAVIRRFAAAPRLILTVVTIGLVQVFAFVAIYVPGWLGGGGLQAATVDTPFDGLKLTRNGRVVLTGTQLFALAVVIAMCAGLIAFFRRTRIGIAMRAAAENADRALLLAIPVRTIGTVAWAGAGLFAGTTIFLRSTLIGIPFDGSLGYSVLLYALAAAVVGRMERIGVALLAGIGVGVLEQACVARTGSPDLTSAIMLGVILAALIAQRGALSRAADSGVASFSLLREFRPVPLELRGLREIVVARYALIVLVTVGALAAPFVVGAGSIGLLTLLPIYALVAVSLVMLTGWAGQISLGQMGIVGASAAVAGGLAANHNIDATIALGIGIVVGAGVAVLVGLPAIRLQGLYLAVTTLCFAGAAEFWFLKSGYPVADRILPAGENPRVLRPTLWHRIDLGNDRTFYFVCVVVLAMVLFAAQSFRRSRSGRLFLAVRDNSRAAPSFAVNVVRTRLAAFALSGAIAGIAGVLLVYQQRVFDAPSYGIAPSLEIFVITVIGGVTSLVGAVYGVVLIKGSEFFLQPWLTRHVHLNHLNLLFTGPGLLLGLYFLPGGQAQALFDVRDRVLRWVAARRGVEVPSLVADRRVEATDPDLVVGAEHHLDELDDAVVA